MGNPGTRMEQSMNLAIVNMNAMPNSSSSKGTEVRVGGGRFISTFQNSLYPKLLRSSGRCSSWIIQTHRTRDASQRPVTSTRHLMTPRHHKESAYGSNNQSQSYFLPFTSGAASLHQAP